MVFINKIASTFFIFLVNLDYKIMLLINSFNNYLFAIDGNFFRNFFITLGASFLGVLAIVFSLSLFAIQYASENNTPKIFKGFIEDKRNKGIYISIGIMVIILFLFALLPISKSFILLQLFFVFVFLVFLLWLLHYQYKRVAYSINPIFILGTLKKDTLKRLSAIEFYLSKNTKKILSSKSVDKKKNTNEIKAAIIIQNKNLFIEIMADINEIFDLIIKNSKKNN